MKFIFAPDSFKGTMSSAEVCRLLTQAASEVFENAECISLPMADGGEGSLETIKDAVAGDIVKVDVCGPLGDHVVAEYCVFGNGKAFIEMAQASGLELVPKELRNPLWTSTYGTGQLIFDALKRGCKDIYIAIGGSATNDGGMGCMRALGVKFYGSYGEQLRGVGSDLVKVKSIDLSDMLPEIRAVNFTVLCDVENPLCGENGATKVYGPQKGATSQQVELLEAGMLNYCEALDSKFGKSANSIAGAGAAGGLGAALMLFLNARKQSGIKAIMEITGFADRLNEVDAVITGEGRVDIQSAQGKVLKGIGECCKSRGIPAFAIVGSKGDGWKKILNCGINSVASVTEQFTIDEALHNSSATFLQTARIFFENLKSRL